MGNCQTSIAEQKRVSQRIDYDILTEFNKARKSNIVKLLLLGSGESGKSTIVKQMKILNLGGYTEQERINYKQIIYLNIYHSTKCLSQAVEKLSLDIDASYRSLIEQFLFDVEQMILYDNIAFTQEIGEHLSNIWNNPIIAKVQESELYLPDSTTYFSANLSRICGANFIPDDQDILRSRAKTTGISEIKFELSPLSIHLFDVGGQRNERKKWIHCFEGVTCVIFVVAFSEYNQVLLENPDVNRLDESIKLFESVINARWFLRSSVIFFMNKSDLFKTKLKAFPLEKLFSDYNHGPDASKAGKFILSKFIAVNRQKLKIYPHFTNATDTNQVKIVMGVVKDTLVQQTLKGNGMF